MVIKESAEMYLETILVLSKKGNVRAIDIAKEMNFSRPSVSIALHNLEQGKYISIGDDQSIKLLSKGEEIAKTIFEVISKKIKFFLKNSQSIHELVLSFTGKYFFGR